MNVHEEVTDVATIAETLLAVTTVTVDQDMNRKGTLTAEVKYIAVKIAIMKHEMSRVLDDIIIKIRYLSM